MTSPASPVAGEAADDGGPADGQDRYWQGQMMQEVDQPGDRRQAAGIGRAHVAGGEERPAIAEEHQGHQSGPEDRQGVGQQGAEAQQVIRQTSMPPGGGHAEQQTDAELQRQSRAGQQQGGRNALGNHRRCGSLMDE